MHNTQNEHRSAMSAIFENLNKIEKNNSGEIDFDTITLEKENFIRDIKVCQMRKFIGDENESIEIDSLVNLINSESTFSATPNSFKLCENLEETGTDEILHILKNPKKVIPVRGLSKSTPDFYNSRKVCLKGKVLKNEMSTISPKTNVPERVSNPLFKNFGLKESDCLNYINSRENKNSPILY